MNMLQALSQELESLVARVTPSVVGVEQGDGQGSGLALSQDDHVLTNAHVVRARRGITVRTSGGSELDAEVVGSDPKTDLAVLRTRGGKLRGLPLAKSPARVGQLVVAIGNPLRFERSVSLGVVSALDRTLPVPRGGLIEGLVQTDAAINPGNSGGPLLDVQGQVIGINTAIIPYAQGIGFAVPAHTAQWVSEALLTRGSIQRPYVGVAARGEELREELATKAGQNRGVRLLEVGSNTPADRAGLRAGDVLLTVDHRAVGSIDDVQRALVYAVHRDVPLSFWRGNERKETALRPTSPTTV